MSQLNITGISNQLNRFKTQIQSESIKTKEGYTGLLNDALKQSYWDLMVAKLDIFLNQITNGSWSLSKKTVLIQHVDSFKESFFHRLNELPDEILKNSEFMSFWIDREIFSFATREILTAQLTSDVSLSLKSEKEACPAIQLSSASRLLAEYPLSSNKRTVFPDYTSEMAKYIPQELSQRLYTLMSSYKWYHSLPRLQNELTFELKSITNSPFFDSLISLVQDSFASQVNSTLNGLRDYLNTSGYGNHTPFDLSSLTNEVPTESWFPVRDWLMAANTNVGSVPDMPDNIQKNIYALLNLTSTPVKNVP